MGKTIMVSERSQHQGDKYHTVSHMGDAGLRTVGAEGS